MYDDPQDKDKSDTDGSIRDGGSSPNRPSDRGSSLNERASGSEGEHPLDTGRQGFGESWKDDPLGVGNFDGSSKDSSNSFGERAWGRFSFTSGAGGDRFARTFHADKALLTGSTDTWAEDRLNDITDELKALDAGLLGAKTGGMLAPEASPESEEAGFMIGYLSVKAAQAVTNIVSHTETRIRAAKDLIDMYRDIWTYGRADPPNIDRPFDIKVESAPTRLK